MRHRIILLLAAALLLSLGTRTGRADEKNTAVEIRESFKTFAAAVKEEKYDEAARWISPPADKIWTNFGVAWAGAAKYDAALEKKFGKSDDSSLLGDLGKKGGLAEHFFETRGEIRGVTQAGTDRVHVQVWTTRPDWRKPSENALYERTFTAVQSDGRWTFQLHTFGGTPTVKTVKRKTADGKEVEVYAEDLSKPISYEGREKDLKQEAAMWVAVGEVLTTQTAQVQKGAYKTRKEALQKALPKD